MVQWKPGLGAFDSCPHVLLLHMLESKDIPDYSNVLCSDGSDAGQDPIIHLLGIPDSQ